LTFAEKRAVLFRLLESSSVGRFLIDRAFALADLLRLNTGYRDGLRMCLPLESFEDQGTGLPKGYTLRIITDAADCTAADVASWQEVLTRADFQEISERTFQTEFVDRALVALLFLSHDDHLVAVTGLVRLTVNQLDAGLISYVAVDPAHRGKSLGQILTALAVRQARAAGLAAVFLETQDDRVPAVKTYLVAGFRPCLSSWDRSHRYRWRKVLARTGRSLSFCDSPRHRATAWLPQPACQHAAMGTRTPCEEAQPR
jgi:mycothiol synthase